MNKTAKFLSITVAMFAIVGLFGVLNNQAYARPDPGYPVGDHVMTIHLKGVPNDTDRNCDNGSSNNIYTMYDTNKGDIQVNHQHILWNHADTNAVTDHCTENVGDVSDPAEVDLQNGSYVYTLRILGPNKDTNTFTYCSQTQFTHDNEEHCVLDTTVVRDNGNPKFTIPQNIFSDEFDGEVWSFVTGSDFRNAQIDIWEAP